MPNTTITKVQALEILDSRGNPTVRAGVTLQNGAAGAAARSQQGPPPAGTKPAKSGTATPTATATRVLAAVTAVNRLAETVMGLDAPPTNAPSTAPCAEADGTGINPGWAPMRFSAVSLAAAHAAAAARGVPLWRHLVDLTGRHPCCPRPMMNILNGGRHAPNNIDIQEFMIIPLGTATFARGLERCVQVTHRLGVLLEEQGLACGVGDEGGTPSACGEQGTGAHLAGDGGLPPDPRGRSMALALDAAAGNGRPKAACTARPSRASCRVRRTCYATGGS